MDERFKQRLEESMWIHKPLTADETQTVEYINKNNMLIYQKGAEEKDGLFKKIRRKEKETEEKEKKE